ncbi:uncharacterized mitochondrial protein AtMg00810-like [Nicotiana sylvestris]|uniref:uncharacterized mitochondrial protein AtMg00810-like n=1 Tax=Nicotiana sylvestris TaxID=4096 RepID=UPI00388CC0E0
MHRVIWTILCSPKNQVVLRKNFKIKDLGELRYFLGIKFARSNEGILMHQRKYSLELISDMGLAGARPLGALVELNQKLTNSEFDAYVGSSSDRPLEDPSSYQRLIGRMLYLTITRPDIAFDVQCLSQFIHAPKASHMEEAIRVVRYVKQASGLGILMLSHNSPTLQASCDADWASYPNTINSITGYLIKFGDFLISWRSKKLGISLNCG